jgi:chorismate synthase
MGRLRYLTAGESHGEALLGILEGIPAGLPLSEAALRAELKRRQGGYGRGGRQKIERDRAQILCGLRYGETLGSPIGLLLRNRDCKNWSARMAREARATRSAAITVPRPGHVDYAGLIKYRRKDIRDLLERASARETAMRVALGTIARLMLQALGVEIGSHIVRIGAVAAAELPAELSAAELNRRANRSPVRCLDRNASRAMVEAIDAARAARDSLGGIYEVAVDGLPPGLGSHVHWDRKLDGRLAQALMSIPATKAVEIGAGFAQAAAPGSQVHDEFLPASGRRVARATNRAGGLEAGITNGERLLLRGAMKPISTLMRPLRSVDLATQKPAAAFRERADVCAVPAAGVIAEAVAALVLADAVLEKFGGDSMEELLEAWQRHRNYWSG